MWLRALTIAAVLVAWIIVRKRARLPIVHPWLFAPVAGCAASVVSDFSSLRHGAGAHALYALAALLGLSGICLLCEGLRVELHLPRSSRRIAVLVALCVVTSALCGFLPTPRNRMVADITAACFLLMLLPPLMASPKRLASWILATGIVAYAVGRTAMTFQQLNGGDVLGLERLLDSGTFAIVGAGIIAFVLDGKVRNVPRVSASDSRRHCDTPGVL